MRQTTIQPAAAPPSHPPPATYTRMTISVQAQLSAGGGWRAPAREAAAVTFFKQKLEGQRQRGDRRGQRGATRRRRGA
eukprot:5188492-Prymnesium_polylepis.1